MVKRIKVLGAGAVGCLVGGLLACGGQEVVFSGSEEVEKALGKQGLRIRLPDRPLKLAKPSSRELEGYDFLLVTLKRQQLKALKPAHIARVPLRPGGRIVFFNCDPEDARLLAPEGVDFHLCLSLLTAVMLQPGDVELPAAKAYLVLEKNPQLRELFSCLKSFAVELLEVDAISPYANSFFLWQSLFLPVALCHSTYDHFLSYAEGREMARYVLTEALETLVRSGRSLKKLPWQDPQELLKRVEKHEREFEEARYRPDRAYNSLLQSILRGKVTEARELNGRVVKMAAEAGVDALWNWKLTQKLNRVLQVGFFKDPARLYQAAK